MGSKALRRMTRAGLTHAQAAKVLAQLGGFDPMLGRRRGEAKRRLLKNPSEGEDRVLARRLVNLMKRKRVIGLDDVYALSWWDRFASRGYTGRDLKRVLGGLAAQGGVLEKYGSDPTTATWRLPEHNPRAPKAPRSIGEGDAREIERETTIRMMTGKKMKTALTEAAAHVLGRKVPRAIGGEGSRNYIERVAGRIRWGENPRRRRNPEWLRGSMPSASATGYDITKFRDASGKLRGELFQKGEETKFLVQNPTHLTEEQLRRRQRQLDAAAIRALKAGKRSRAEMLAEIAARYNVPIIRASGRHARNPLVYSIERGGLDTLGARLDELGYDARPAGLFFTNASDDVIDYAAEVPGTPSTFQTLTGGGNKPLVLGRFRERHERNPWQLYRRGAFSHTPLWYLGKNRKPGEPEYTTERHRGEMFYDAKAANRAAKKESYIAPTLVIDAAASVRNNPRHRRRK